MNERAMEPASHRRLTLSSIGGVGGRRGSSLTFQDIDVTVNEKDKKILQSVAGSVEPGEMLAIMGPSGENNINV